MSSDSEALQGVGLDFVMKVARISFEGVFYGIYLILIYFSVLIFSHRNALRSKGTIYLIIVILVMFAGSSLFFAMDIADLVQRMKIILINDPDQSIEDKLSRADEKTKHLMWTGEMLFIFMLTLGDSVVLWRTWSLYQDQKKYLIVPLCTWTGSVIAAFFELGCDVHTHWAIADSTPSAASVGAEVCARADTASYSMSFGTNLICTCLIVYKAWQHRQFMSQYLGPSRRKTRVEKILTLLIESGSVYLVLYTLQAIPIYGGTTPSSYIPWLVVNAIIQQAMGMYPTAIVVLVQMQKSLWAADNESVVVHNRAANTRLESGLQFAPERKPATTGGEVATGISTTRSHGDLSTSASTARGVDKSKEQLSENQEGSIV